MVKEKKNPVANLTCLELYIGFQVFEGVKIMGRLVDKLKLNLSLLLDGSHFSKSMYSCI